MPKSYPHKGLIAVGGGGVGRRLQERRKREHDPVTRARSSERQVRDAIEEHPELAVWVGSRLYVLDNEDVLDTLAEALGLDLPAAVKPARANRTASPSSANAPAAAPTAVAETARAKTASKKPVPAKVTAAKPARAKRTALPSNPAAVARL